MCVCVTVSLPYYPRAIRVKTRNWVPRTDARDSISTLVVYYLRTHDNTHAIIGNMHLDTPNIRVMIILGVFVVYFTLVAWLPSSFYNTDEYQPFWNGLTNFLIWTFYIVGAFWMMHNAKKGDYRMFGISLFSILGITIVFFKLFVFSFIG